MFLRKDYPFEEDSSSDSDSDDVQIHIGQIRTTPFSQLVFMRTNSYFLKYMIIVHFLICRPYRPQQKPPPGMASNSMMRIQYCLM